jgi:hypothetical protein
VKESRERYQDTCYVGSRPRLQAYPPSGKFVPRLENPEAGSQTQEDHDEGDGKENNRAHNAGLHSFVLFHQNRCCHNSSSNDVHTPMS